MDKTLSVGEIAKRSGLTISTIHFYEEKQLISSTRNNGNQRRYSKEILRRLAVIVAAKKVGLTLEEIKAGLATLPLNRSSTQQDWQQIANNWKDLLNQKIGNLQKLRDSLTTCIGCGCLSMKKCPLYNKDDKLSKEGSGAMLLKMD